MSQEKSIELILDPSEKWRILKNVAVISVAFMINFIGYSAAANLQSSINAEAGLGTASLAAVYSGILISNIFLPAILIKWLGEKWTICCSFVMPYIATQVYPSFYTLVPAGFLLGLGAAPLWCAKCTYLAAVAEAFSTRSKLPAGTLLARFLGFFFMIYQTNQIWGNLLSSLVLSSGNNAAAVTSVNKSMIPLVCGSNFLANTDAEHALAPQPANKMLIITFICLAYMAIAVLIVAMGLDPVKRYEPFSKNGKEKNKLSGVALLTVTMKQLKNPNQLLLLILNIFIGQQQAFFSADFPASFVSCAVGTGSVGYVMMTFGLSDAIGCLFTGYLAKLFGRLPLICGALCVHGAVFITMLVWQPHDGDISVMFVIAMLWGLCDSVWGVQTNAFHGVLFPGHEEGAFSNYRLWSSLGYILTYMMSSYVRTRYKVFLLLSNMTVGVVGYLIVEYRQCKIDKQVKMIEP